MKVRPVCPKCFSKFGFSIPLEERDNVFNCTKDSTHRFKRDKEGFLESLK